MGGRRQQHLAPGHAQVVPGHRLRAAPYGEQAQACCSSRGAVVCACCTNSIARTCAHLLMRMLSFVAVVNSFWRSHMPMAEAMSQYHAPNLLIMSHSRTCAFDPASRTCPSVTWGLWRSLMGA